MNLMMVSPSNADDVSNSVIATITTVTVIGKRLFNIIFQQRLLKYNADDNNNRFDKTIHKEGIQLFPIYEIQTFRK